MIRHFFSYCTSICNVYVVLFPNKKPFRFVSKSNQKHIIQYNAIACAQ